MLDISVVTHNSARHLESLIASLVSQDIDLSHIALLVHDNASTDRTLAVLEELLEPHRDTFRDISIIAGEENLGFGKAHNAAIAEGHGDLIFILNPDAELRHDTLRILLEQADKDPEQVVAWETRQTPYEHPKIYDPLTQETSWVSGAGVMVRRDAFEAIDGFEPRIFLYGEDVDLSWRLREQGGILKYVPRAVLIHHTYQHANEVKPAQFVGSTRANLFLRTRFGNWHDILRGIILHLALILFPSHQYIPRQRLLTLRGLIKWLLFFRHFRNGSNRSITHTFSGWDYTPARAGAFHDISAGLSIENPPKVSVLIRTIGRKGLLAQALQSLCNQTYSNFEVIVVQDGPESLLKLLTEYQDRLNLTYKPLGESKGRCIAGNEALSLASGEYCVFLDEDDLFYADHLEQLVAAVDGEEAKVAYSFAFEVPSKLSEDGNKVLEEGEYRSHFRESFSFLRLLHGNYIPILTVLFHRSLFETCGGFDPELDHNEDWNLWVRYSMESRPFICVPKTTSLYRIPMDQDAHGSRHQTLLHYQDLAREKQASLTTTVSIEELLSMEAPTQIQILGLEDALVHRFPRMGRVIRLIARIYREMRR